MFVLEPHLLMAATLFFVLLAILLYAWERMAMEIISVGIIGLLLVFYTIFGMVVFLVPPEYFFDVLNIYFDLK